MLDDEILVEGLSASEQRAVAVLLDSDEQVSPTKSGFVRSHLFQYRVVT